MFYKPMNIVIIVTKPENNHQFAIYTQTMFPHYVQCGSSWPMRLSQLFNDNVRLSISDTFQYKI